MSVIPNRDEYFMKIVKNKNLEKFPDGQERLRIILESLIRAGLKSFPVFGTGIDQATFGTKEAIQNVTVNEILKQIQTKLLLNIEIESIYRAEQKDLLKNIENLFEQHIDSVLNISKKLETLDSLVLTSIINKIESQKGLELVDYKVDTMKGNSGEIYNSNFSRIPRNIYKENVIETVETNPKSLRAVVVGPHFLEPFWVMQKRLKRTGRHKSFALTLHNYLLDSLNEKDRKIRLILRNDNRYPQILEPDVERNQIKDLIQEMKSNLHSLISDQNFILNFHCLNPGNYYHQVIIIETNSEKLCFVPSRKKYLEPIEEGIKNEDLEFIEWQITQFENFFYNNYKGPEIEIVSLENYITSLEFSLNEIKDKR